MAIYYSINAAHSSFVLHEEISYLKNLSNQSLIDHDITSETSAVFSALICAFSSCGVFTTLLLFYGIYKILIQNKYYNLGNLNHSVGLILTQIAIGQNIREHLVHRCDIKYLLMPWIFNMVFFTIVDVIYIINGLIVHALQWNPSVAILVTVDFFLNTLNLYALLCVISQYQEYKAGRGRAIDDQILRVPNIQYSTTQPTATSYLSSHRKTLPYIDKPTPTHSPTGLGTNILDAPPLTNRGPRKSVKFGDSPEMSMIPPPAWLDTKTVQNKGIDTAPLIDSRTDGGGTLNV